jgi:hypothetical protein
MGAAVVAVTTLGPTVAVSLRIALPTIIVELAD